PDCTKFTISNANNDVNQPNSQIFMTTHDTFPTADGNYPPAQRQSVNEFKDYINEKYLSAPEAAWRIFRYHVTSPNPPVQALLIHLPNSNISQPIEPLFDNLKYTEYYEQYIQYPFNQHINENIFLEQEQNNVLRKIVRKWSTSKVTRVVLITPKAEAACNMCLFTVKNKSILAMKEAIDNFYTPAQLCFLFVQLILDSILAVDLCQKYNTKLSKDFKEQFQNNQYLATNATLQQIALMITEHDQSLVEKSHSQMIIEQATLYDKVVFHILYESENESVLTTKFLIFLDGKAAPKTSASKMLASKPLAPKPLVANPLPSETLPPVIHPSPLSNLTNNLLLQQRQFPTTQLQVDSLNELTSKYNELLSLNISRDQENSLPLDPIAINPSSATISTVSHDPTSAFVTSS
ncbi:13679_t:CDS:2, partial [Cetraspora pellucida]